jgi:hypothetical protein
MPHYQRDCHSDTLRSNTSRTRGQRHGISHIRRQLSSSSGRSRQNWSRNVASPCESLWRPSARRVAANHLLFNARALSLGTALREVESNDPCSFVTLQHTATPRRITQFPNPVDRNLAIRTLSIWISHSRGKCRPETVVPLFGPKDELLRSCESCWTSANDRSVFHDHRHSLALTFFSGSSPPGVIFQPLPRPFVKCHFPVSSSSEFEFETDELTQDPLGVCFVSIVILWMARHWYQLGIGRRDCLTVAQSSARRSVKAHTACECPTFATK